MLFLYKICTYDLLVHDSPKCHWPTLCQMLQARSGLCMYPVLLVGVCVCVFVCARAQAFMHRWWTVRSIVSADRGVHTTCFILRVYLHCALILLCLGLWVAFFCWTLYGTFWPRVCSVLILLLDGFWQFEFPFELLFLHLLLYFSCLLSFCYVYSVLCRALVRYLFGIHVVLCFGLVTL